MRNATGSPPPGSVIYDRTFKFIYILPSGRRWAASLKMSGAAQIRECEILNSFKRTEWINIKPRRPVDVNAELFRTEIFYVPAAPLSETKPNIENMFIKVTPKNPTALISTIGRLTKFN